MLHDDELQQKPTNGLEASGLTTDHASPPSEEPHLLKIKQCSSCLILRVFFPFFFFLLSVFVLVFFFYAQITTCTTSDCTNSAARLLANMDTSTDPCDDFYQYSCGVWMNQSVNLNYPSWNMLYRTTVASHDRAVRAMLEASEGQFPHELNEGEEGVVKVFRQCTNSDAMLKLGIEPVRDLIKSLGGWMPDLDAPSPEIFAILDSPSSPLLVISQENEEERIVRQRRQILADPLEEALLRCFNLSTFPLFFAGVQVSYMNSSQHIITMYEQVPLLLNGEYYRGPEPTAEGILRGESTSSAASMLFAMGLDTIDLLGIKSEEAKRRLAEMIVLEWKITNCRPRETERENDLYEVVTLEELQGLSPMLDWRFFLSSLTQTQLEPTEPIALKSGREWMQQLSAVIEDYSSSVEKQLIMRSYMKWKVLTFYLSYTKMECGHQTLWYMLQLYSGPPHLRKEFCVLRLSGIFPLSLPSLLRKADGHQKVMENKETVTKIAEEIRKQYRNTLKTTRILDENTRKNVVEKLENMSIKVSFPDKMEDEREIVAEADRVGATFFESMLIGATAVYKKNVARLRLPVDQRDWVDTKPALSSVPIHNYERNIVILPMDALFAPVADSGQVDSLNYGAIGSYIGHEMTHAFDGEGKQHGPKGSLGDRKWWSSSSKRQFLLQEQCVVEHYKNLSGEAAAHQSRYENIADIVGVELAFQAWKTSGKDTWRWLPGLSLSPEQRFFVAYAQSWCALNTKQSGKKHLTERIRVMGTLRNSEAFSRAFSCPVDSPMNPSRKCRVW